MNKKEVDLGTIVHHEKYINRIQVAKLGVFLEHFLHDKNWIVRSHVAENGYGLETLLHDEHWVVRLKVAKHGFGLNILTYDKNELIRLEVAKHGVNLELLANDECEKVAELAKKMLSCKTQFIRMEKNDSYYNIYVRLFENYYEIECFNMTFNSIEDFHEYLIFEAGLEKAEEYTKIVKDFIELNN